MEGKDGEEETLCLPKGSGENTGCLERDSDTSTDKMQERGAGKMGLGCNYHTGYNTSFCIHNVEVCDNLLCCVLQAVYRGHSLRKKLRKIMESAHHISDDDTSFEEDINLDSMNEVG